MQESREWITWTRIQKNVPHPTIAGNMKMPVTTTQNITWSEKYSWFFSFSDLHKKEKNMETGEYSPLFILFFNYPNVLRYLVSEVNIWFWFVCLFFSQNSKERSKSTW